MHRVDGVCAHAHVRCMHFTPELELVPTAALLLGGLLLRGRRVLVELSVDHKELDIRHLNMYMYMYVYMYLYA